MYRSQKASGKAGRPQRGFGRKHGHQLGHKGGKKLGAKLGGQRKGGKTHAARALLARQAQDAQSGAFSFGDIFKEIGSVLGLKREDVLELMARADPQDLQSGAFNFGSLISGIGHILGFKREEIEMLARSQGNS